MATFEELDALSSRQLHDRALNRAKRRLDVAFFMRLLRSVPAAEAAVGDLDEAQADALHLHELINDALHTEDIDDALRPLYIDYLMGEDEDGHS